MIWNSVISTAVYTWASTMEKIYRSFQCVLFFCTSVIFTQSALAQSVATLYSKEGKVEARFGVQQTKWESVEEDSEFQVTDSLRVGPQSRAGVMFVDGMLIRLKSYSFLRFDSYSADAPAEGEVHLEKGEAYVLSRKDRPHPRITTPIVSAAIRGTEFLIKTDDENTSIQVIDGAVEAKNSFGSVVATRGERIDVKRGAAPVKSILVDVKDSIQWALHYPSVVVYDDVQKTVRASENCWNVAKSGDVAAVDSSCKGESAYPVLNAVALMEQGDPSAAYGKLQAYNTSEPAVMLLRASMASSLGLLDEAELDLKRAASAGGTTGGIAQSQRSIIALVRGKKEETENYLREAQSLAPAAASTYVAAAYVNQSRGDLEGASELIEKALALYPENPFLLALYAEYLHGQDRMREALRTIEKALAIAPEHSYARLVYGFILLTLGEPDDAHDQFVKVHNKESDNPLVHFGLGLFNMNQGNENEGLQFLEQAVHLAPATAIFRSYLGKGFFETDQNEKAINEYDLAIAQDEEDPTPYLYRAFSKLSDNDVVGALRDVTTSMDLNDNRAVYRSEMALDHDSAVRSASLSRIYNELGFSEAGRIEAIKSIAKDYTNFAAHRLLSSAYANGQFRLINNNAALSEDRIGTLLAPLSFNLFFDNGGESSFNEYTALFNKDEERTQIAGTYSSFADGGEGSFVHAGKHDRIGYALSGQHDFSGGSKSGNYLRSYAYNAALQWQPNFWHRFIAEGQFRYVHSAQDDLFEVPANRSYISDARLSYRGRYDHQWQGLATAGYSGSRVDLRSFESDTAVLLTHDALLPEVQNVFLQDLLLYSRNTSSGDFFFEEAQIIGQYDWITSISGVVATQNNARHKDFSLVVDDDGAPFPFDESNSEALNPFVFTGLNWQINNSAKNKPDTSRFYSYNTLHVASWLDLTGGVTYEDVEFQSTSEPPLFEETTSLSRWSPKVGILADPIDNLLIRASYTESIINGDGLFDGSLEPTLVGGLNQTFPGIIDAGKSEVYAFGLDFKIPGWTYIGAEHSRGESKQRTSDAAYVFLFDFAEPLIFEETQVEFSGLEIDVDQDLYTGYFYQVLTDRLVSTNTLQMYDVSFSGQTQFTGEFTGDRNREKGKNASLGLHYFFDNGFIGRVRGNWRDIELTDEGSDFISGANFWTASTALGYRFPDRKGYVELQLNNLLDEQKNLPPTRIGIEDLSTLGFNAVLFASYNF